MPLFRIETGLYKRVNGKVRKSRLDDYLGRFLRFLKSISLQRKSNDHLTAYELTLQGVIIPLICSRPDYHSIASRGIHVEIDSVTYFTLKNLRVK